MTVVLLVDVDTRRRLVVWDRLVEEGYQVVLASLASEAVERALAGGIDLVVLDLDLPDGDGFGVCETLRRSGFGGGLILVSDRETATERVHGLNIGADDVLTRPLELIELSARIEACLRRGTAYPSPRQSLLRFGNIEVDLCGACVSKSGEPVHLSPREFRVLRCLVEQAGTTVSRAELLDRVWGRDATPSPQTVDVHIAWLRRKLEPDPQRPVLIRTVHGVGYVLSDPGAS